jgi:DNA-binding protein HU-beta
MNRRELVNAIAAQTGMEVRQTDAFLRAFTDVTTAVVAKGEPVAISGFAKFVKVQRAARMGRNPQTGEPVKIKASKRARITPLKGFKDSVLTPSMAPKLNSGVWPPAPKAAAKKAAPARKTAGTRSTAKKAPAKKAPAKKATSTRSTAGKTAAKKTTARKASAKKATARR